LKINQGNEILSFLGIRLMLCCLQLFLMIESMFV